MIQISDIPQAAIDQCNDGDQRFAAAVAAYNEAKPRDIDGKELQPGDNVMAINGVQEGRKAVYFRMMTHAEAVQHCLELDFVGLARYGLDNKVRTSLFWFPGTDGGQEGMAIAHCDDMQKLEGETDV